MPGEYGEWTLKDAVHQLTNIMDECRAEAILCLGQMVNDSFDAEPYCPWLDNNEPAIVDCIRSIFGKGVLQKECNERRQGIWEYNAANW